jgi:hypothetical protein
MHHSATRAPVFPVAAEKIRTGVVQVTQHLA